MDNNRIGVRDRHGSYFLQAAYQMKTLIKGLLFRWNQLSLPRLWLDCDDQTLQRTERINVAASNML